ncbi:[FeFe] hydrogenase H-cluster maturation GTPase HydF [Anaerotalea alkaliphila]|uniref:[FeFe] hydrogenase H-cluster maturation GTPase HydF n=1 Tax=Anaerotalea alkaliphila TaxID=2662126 RepID=A0A7X5HY20_9FIRM|nr:[FeFe] hydrogenase H-cluster maturation GTPase HydF [Anaerotalea alkaliphila]NDL68765.1 [FeFe] hydrogenase H-cluster maturation GTPase HydF [Anaerotalea alkaliphila]
MSLNSTPKANRLHIAFFGQTNAGKSSLVNAITNQSIALVSEISGTTTDPVYKAMELLPLGPVTLIDTAGLNDLSPLGNLRKEKTLEVLHKTDVALLVLDGESPDWEFELELMETLRSRKLPVIGILNKVDQAPDHPDQKARAEAAFGIPFHPVSARTGEGIEALKETIARSVPEQEDKFRIVGDLVRPGDFVVLVTPIDKAAPKGRLILPQQQTIRDILESDAIAVVTKEFELRETLEKLGRKPRMVITDSQAFLKVAADTPRDVPMTSFSILFARHKGDLPSLAKGAGRLHNLRDGDKVLIAEGCTHHRQCDDIGTVKIPRWIRQATGKELLYEHVSGTSFPPNLQEFSLIVHCGGCMLNTKAMHHRIDIAGEQEVPMVNYGVLIAYMHGILDRALEPFPLAKMVYEEECAKGGPVHA